MCGRFTISADPNEIAERFNVVLPFLDVFHKSYNIAPSHSVLAIINTNIGRRAGLLRWGLIPSWAKDEQVWLDNNIKDVELLKDILVPYGAADINAYSVSSLVNSPKNNSIDLIAPYC